jgi:hypothetical protein
LYSAAPPVIGQFAWSEASKLLQDAERAQFLLSQTVLFSAERTVAVRILRNGQQVMLLPIKIYKNSISSFADKAARQHSSTDIFVEVSLRELLDCGSNCANVQTDCLYFRLPGCSDVSGSSRELLMCSAADSDFC